MARQLRRPQRLALLAGSQSAGPADIDRDAVTVQDDGDDVGVAAHLADHVGWEVCTVGGLTDGRVVQTPAQRLEVDEHRDLGDAGIGGAGAGDQIDDDVGLQLVERAPVVVSRCR